MKVVAVMEYTPHASTQIDRFFTMMISLPTNYVAGHKNGWVTFLFPQKSVYKVQIYFSATLPSFIPSITKLPQVLQL